jgi:hypothetical protein
LSALAVVLIVIGALLLLLFLGGAVAVRRRNARAAQHRAERVARADAELASAYAEDKGWERAALQTAAHAAFATAHPGHEGGEIHLVGVIDLPGTDEDQAVFEIVDRGHAHRLTLGRSGGEWGPV